MKSKGFPHFMMRDNAAVLLLMHSLIPDPQYGAGLWTTSPPVVNTFRVLFDELWQDAINLDARIEELESVANSV